MEKVRIKDIAEMAGVSTGTVDRVIHGREGVSEATREKVNNLLKEYDYQPDVLAGLLASNKDLRFLICMPEVVNAHEFWRFPELGIEKAMEELTHFDVQVEYLRFDQHSREDFLKKTNEVVIADYDGLLLAPVFQDVSKQFVERWQNEKKAVVLFNDKLEGVKTTSFIGQDAWQSGYLGGKLMSYGLPQGSDLLIVNLSLRTSNFTHIIKRERGFRAYFEEHSDRLERLIGLDLNGGSFKELSKALQEKFDAHDFAGVFVTNSRVHLVARFLEEQGMMNVRLIGYDLISKSVDYLKREYIDFLISQSPEEQAYTGLRSLFNKVGMKQEIVPEVGLPIDILTKENVDQYKNLAP